MRADRFLTLALVHPFRRTLQHFAATEARQEKHLPVLMYHSVSSDPEPGVHPYFKLCTSPQRFAEQMQWLANAGYRGVTLTEGFAALTRRLSGSEMQLADSVSPGDGKLVAITFDDGFHDFHREAFPILQRYGFAATMYLPTAFIGDERRSFKGRECLTWGEIRELQRAGIEFGSHTVNHPRLVELNWQEIETELRESKVTIEERLQVPVHSFAYPYGFPQAEKHFARRFCALLEQIGYRTSVTTAIGRADLSSNQRLLPRLPANSLDDGSFFSAKLQGSYDWLRFPQTLSKTVSRWLRPQTRLVALQTANEQTQTTRHRSA